MPTGVTSWSKTAATNASADSAVNMAEGMAPSAVNDGVRGLMASGAMYRDDTAGTLTTGGTSTAYTVTSNQGFASLAAMNGAELTIKFNATSGAAPTLAVDGLTAKPINVSVATAVGTGVILANSIWSVTYDNSNNIFVLRGVPAQIQDGTVATASIAAAAVTYAKIQNVGASSLIGNATGSPATATAITLGAGLSFVGTALTPGISAVLVPNYLSGLTMSTAGSSGTMSIAAGVANDSTNTTLMSLAAISKTTASWAVGTGNGGIDTGSIANSTWYHFYLIERTDTGVTDIIFSLSASAPAYPTGYTLSRRIGSGKTDGSAHWTSFTQTVDQFTWAAPVTDASGIATTTSRVSTALTVPSGGVVTALFRSAILASASAGTGATIFTSLLENDQTPTNAAICDLTYLTNGFASGNFARITNTSQQIGVRSDVSGGSAGALTISTYGWIDTRGK